MYKQWPLSINNSKKSWQINSILTRNLRWQNLKFTNAHKVCGESYFPEKLQMPGIVFRNACANIIELSLALAILFQSHLFCKSGLVAFHLSAWLWIRICKNVPYRNVGGCNMTTVFTNDTTKRMVNSSSWSVIHKRYMMCKIPVGVKVLDNLASLVGVR